MKERKPRRNPKDKERFMEGNRQRWVAIGLSFTLLTLLCNILWKIDPAPYLQAVMLLIGAGVLGWSVDSAVKAYKVSSETESKSNEENRREERKDETKSEITYTEKKPRPRDYDDLT